MRFMFAFALLMAIVAVHAAPVEDTMSQYVAQIANDDEEDEPALVRKVRQANEEVTEPSVEATTVEEEDDSSSTEPSVEATTVEEEGDSSTALPNSSEEEGDSSSSEEEGDCSSSEEVTEPSVEATTVEEEDDSSTTEPAVEATTVEEEEEEEVVV